MIAIKEKKENTGYIPASFYKTQYCELRERVNEDNHSLQSKLLKEINKLDEMLFKSRKMRDSISELRKITYEIMQYL